VAGATLGIDHDFTNDMLAGVSLGYARTNLHLDRNLGDGDINATLFSVYGSYFTDSGYVEGALSHGNNYYANTRNIQISGSSSIASSYHDGSLLSGTLAGGYYFKVREWTWEPFAALQYSSLSEDSFDETGAGAVSLHVDARRTQYLSSDLGLRFRRTLERANGILVPELSLAWNYDFAIDDRLITASFTGSPNASFSVQGQDIERNGARLGGGVAYVNKKGLTSSMYYDAELRNGYIAQGLTGEIRYEFK
jgi:outer membrane autotransporter protein